LKKRFVSAALPAWTRHRRAKKNSLAGDRGQSIRISPGRYSLARASIERHSSWNQNANDNSNLAIQGWLNTAMAAGNEYLATHPRANPGTQLKNLRSRAAKLRVSGWTTFNLEGRRSL
jgi:hypothetical protein